MKLGFLSVLIFTLTQLAACSGGDEPKKVNVASPTPTPSPQGELWEIDSVEDLQGVWQGEADISEDLEEYLGRDLQQTVIAEYYVSVDELGFVRDYVYLGNIPTVSFNCYIAVEQIFSLVHIEDNVFVVDGWEGRVTVNRTDDQMFINAQNGLSYTWALSNITQETLSSQTCESLPDMNFHSLKQVEPQ